LKHKTSYTPDLFQSFMAMGDAVLNQKDFDPRARELAILAVMAVYDVPFVLYAHTRIAMKLGLSEEQVSSASKGTTPTGLTEEEAIIYTTALELARARGPLNEQSWQAALKALGREKCARLAHVVGVYLYSSTLLNLGAIPAPED
jgi:alkylhydroperoxidase family enzyme